ncbi:MAG: hypothetical protein E7625_02445 [Ruminococcaceae bacterium]|nr:hypothetical protein [Oscillospiraceae bacterium]
MVTVQSRIISIGMCIIEVIWLLIAQTMGSTLLLLPCLACFLVLIVWAAFQGMALPTLLFFMPFASLLKFRPGMISFYTVALLIVYVIYAVKGIKNININHMVPGLALAALALVVKTLYGYSIDNSFILFFASILLVPFFTRELREKYDFYYLTTCFTLGIVIAAITAQYLVIFPSIRQYIQQLEHSGIIRYSGFYSDPNFYSAHITAALGGVLVLMLNSAKKRRIFWLMVMAVMLVYCGSLGVSKSFLVIAVALTLFWFFALMLERGKFTVKITILMTLLVGVAFLLASTIFTDQVAMFLARLSYDNNLADFTTGRTRLWNQYLNSLFGDPKLLFFGKGLSNVLLNGRGAHNVLIQCVYQFGLLGLSLLAAWFVCHVRTLLRDISIGWKHFAQIAVLMIGTLGPWLGLDMLFSDEFFLMPMYVCVGVIFLSRQDEKMESVQSNQAEVKQ